MLTRQDRQASFPLSLSLFFFVSIYSVMPSLVREYPVSADEYELLEEAGRGVSATVRHLSMLCVLSGLMLSPWLYIQLVTMLFCQVWKARCKATGEDVAVKLLDLENLNCSLVGGGLACC
jgi:hypothetical protein